MYAFEFCFRKEEENISKSCFLGMVYTCLFLDLY